MSVLALNLVITVVFRSPQTPHATFRFHLKTLSDGGRHPLSPTGGAVVCQKLHRVGVSFTLQVSGQYLGVLVHDMTGPEGSENELLIWNWTSGELKTVGSQANYHVHGIQHSVRF